LPHDELCDIPDKIEQTFATARKLASAEKSTITIGSFMLPQISHAINLAIRTFGETNPDTICELEHQGYAGLRQGLEAGDFDLIMLPVFDIPLLKCEVCSKTLMRIPASIAVRANHPLAERSDLKLIDFKDCDFILTSPEESSAGYNSIIKLCEDRGFTPHIGRTVKTLDTLLLAVELGNGVALVDSTLTLAPYSPIKLVPLNDDIFSDIAVVWRADADTKNLEGMVNALSSAFEL
ncbi:MAG: LysR family substrate-binding domain-containing protein, partial [Oscillospiraceae bacterium]|nr:LysR family substrate-binding domain-containing protein [Oscillospiraceae bacterium]